MHPALTDGRILVRPLAPDDIEALFAAVRESAGSVGRWMSWCHPDYTMGEAGEWIAHSEGCWAALSDREFGIFDAGSRQLLGCIGINQFNRVNNFANIGYWVRTSRTGNGIATAAVRLLAKYGFEALQLSRIEIVARVDNVASRRVAEKVGCRFEAIARNRIDFRGQPCDAALYSLIPGDLSGDGGAHEEAERLADRRPAP